MVKLPTSPIVNPASARFADNMQALTARAKQCMVAAQRLIYRRAKSSTMMRTDLTKCMLWAQKTFCLLQSELESTEKWHQKVGRNGLDH